MPSTRYDAQMCSAIFSTASRFFSWLWVLRELSSRNTARALWWLAMAALRCSGRRQDLAVK
ncbi:hypothetical protein D3C71_2026620 [compost metagenome]